jgi:hypothetical protein
MAVKIVTKADLLLPMTVPTGSWKVQHFQAKKGSFPKKGPSSRRRYND